MEEFFGAGIAFAIRTGGLGSLDWRDEDLARGGPLPRAGMRREVLS